MNNGRKSTPRGQMSSSNSGPAIMMMPPQIRATFMPDPPLRHLPPPKRKRPKMYPDSNDDINTNGVKLEDNPKQKQPTKSKRLITGVAAYMNHFEHTASKRVLKSTPASLKALRAKKKCEKIKSALEPLIKGYRAGQRDSGVEYQGMNCYNTLFVGRLAYEVTDGKLLREFENFGPVKDVKLISVKKDAGEEEEDGEGRSGKSRGYAFIEFENDVDMKRAYRSADAIRIEGRPIVVDVERGHTVPNWLPRRLGGGLGGTRLGGKDFNITAPGRYNPNAPPKMPEPPHGNMMDRGGPQGNQGYGNGPGGGGAGGHGGSHGPPPGRGGHGGGGGGMHGNPNNGPPPGHFNDPRGGGPPPGYYNNGGGGRGPPPPNFRGGGPRDGPPRGYYDDHRGGGPPPHPRDRGMKRGRSYGNGGGGGPPPSDRRDRRRY